MKLVTIDRSLSALEAGYIPGKCNIGTRGRAIRLSTGAILIAVSVVIGLTLLGQFIWLTRFFLILPVYIGLLAALEGSMSFCVLHGARGTYDFHEPKGFASKRSKTLGNVGSADWKKLDRRKALRMHMEALAGAFLVASLLALA